MLVVQPRDQLHDIWKWIIGVSIRIPTDIVPWQLICTWTREQSLIHGSVTGTAETAPGHLLKQMRNWHSVFVQTNKNLLTILAAQSHIHELIIHDITCCDQILALFGETQHGFGQHGQALTCEHLIISFTDINTVLVPQVRSLQIIDHRNLVDITHLTRIEKLYIRNSSIGFSLAVMSSLTSLNIDDIDEDVPDAWLPPMPMLKRLRANVCVRDLYMMTSLTRLDAPVCDVSGLRSLTDITMRKPHCANLSTLSITSLVSLPITILRVYNPIDDFNKLTQLTSLRQLHIYMRYAPYGYVRHMTQLHTLTIYGSPATKKVILNLTNLTSLTIIDSQGTIVEEDLTSLTSLTHLRFTSPCRI